MNAFFAGEIMHNSKQSKRTMPITMPITLPFNSHYVRRFFDDDVVAKAVAAEDMHHYMYRGKHMKRAPKNEFFYPGHHDKTYKWGQQVMMYPGGAQYTGLQMPEWMIAIADFIREELGQPVNHAILIKYDHGTKTHAPPPQDKLPADSSFFVFSFGTRRRFDVHASQTVECFQKKRDADGNPVPMMQTVHGSTLVKTKQTAGPVVWSKKLAHNSMLVVDGQTNKNYWHAVPQDKAWAGERYSLIVRVINAA
jgi:hypothetical protein